MNSTDSQAQFNFDQLRQRFCVLSPLNMPNSALINASYHAGYWSVLDLGDPNLSARHRSLKELQQLKHLLGIGIRVTRGLGAQQWSPQNLSKYVKQGLVRQIIISEEEDWGRWASLRALAPQEFELWVEVKSLASALRADRDQRIKGLVICTEEASGFCGNLSVYMWLQTLQRQEFQSPLWIRGGMSLSGMLSSLCLGIERVVIDEHLLGCAESTLDPELLTIQNKLDRSHSIKLNADRVSLKPKSPQIKNTHTDSKPQSELQIRVLSWPMSKAWQLQKELDKVNQADQESKLQDVQSSLHQQGVYWGDCLSNHLVPLGSLWPLINHTVNHLKDELGEPPRCREVLNCIVEEVFERLQLASEVTPPLQAKNQLSRSYGLNFPIFQGPMTRVSDDPNFALSVAEHGALPFIALSLLNPEKAKTLLTETQNKLGDLPWGIGILGFSPPELREAHLKLIMEFKPNAVLIAGGRPSQSRALEEAGIHTYLHAPSPELLSHFIDEGARRFIFEGAECGGHIGPSNSFALWDAQLSVIENSSFATEITAIFAGGIHDACSAGILNLITSKASQLGVKIGALMGTAYLFTHEAVQSGAILNRYQKVAIDLKNTTVLSTAPGHSTRCAPTPFVDQFHQEKKRLCDAGMSDRTLWSELEQLNVGRLRIASKGITRQGEHLVEVDDREQIETGMYMIGDLASLRDHSFSMKELHDTVSLESSDWIQSQLQTLNTVQASLHSVPIESDNAIAIVGISCLFPKANDHHQFWSNILEGLDCIEDIPSHRWSIEQYYDPEAPAGVKSASKWGAFLDATPFDPIKYGIPPQTLSAVEPVQLLALEVAARALEDAGYSSVNKGSVKRSFNRTNTSVIFGAEAGTELASAYTLRAVTPQWLGYLPPELDASLPKLTEDSFAGVLANVISGRIANRLDLGGVNYTVDAACASSLAALDSAVKSLRTAESDMVICGGADLHNSVNDYLMFSSVHALSKTGKCKPFSQDADGIALGEGIAALVLKRAEDARRDGDRVYALISSVAGSSDGKALGLTAPREDGQIRALERAYSRAHVSSTELGLIEAHGTGTVVGDRTELNALTTLFGKDRFNKNQMMTTTSGQSPTTQKCSLGSVKSMIGHTKCAAGLAGVIKATMAIYHKVRPPTLNIQNLNEAYQAKESPFCFERNARPWLSLNRKRLAGVSAFGFGGTNFHAVIQEEIGQTHSPKVRNTWASEPIIIFAQNEEDARQKAKDVCTALVGLKQTEKSKVQIRSLAYTLFKEAQKHAKQLKEDLTAYTLIQAKSLDEAEIKLRAYAEGLEAEHKDILCLSSLGNRSRFQKKLYGSDQLAFVFPGQGAQKVGMMNQLFHHFPKLIDRLEVHPEIASMIFPPHPNDRKDKSHQQERLTDTRIAQPALGLCDLAMYELLQDFGLDAGHVAGHSYGELVALCVAGYLPEEKLCEISAKRGELILEATGALNKTECTEESSNDSGSMAAVSASADQVQSVLQQYPELKDVVLANLNAPKQNVISGPSPQIEIAIQKLKDEQLRARKIPVACAFHSRLVASAAPRFQAYIEQFVLSATVDSQSTAQPVVWSNQSAQTYDFKSEPNLASQLGNHLASPVRFVEQITSMIGAGVKAFVEVGPGRILSGLIEQIVNDLDLDEEIFILPCAPMQANTHELLSTVMQLSWLGYPVDWENIWRHRQCELLDSQRLQTANQPKLLWWINGMRAWPDLGPMPNNYLNPLNRSVDPNYNLSNAKSNEQHVLSLNQSHLGSIKSKPMSPNAFFKEVNQVSSDTKLSSAQSTSSVDSGNAVALAAKAYFESMQSLAQAQERVMLALLGQDVEHRSVHSPSNMPQAQSNTESNQQDFTHDEVIDFWSTPVDSSLPKSHRQSSEHKSIEAEIELAHSSVTLSEQDLREETEPKEVKRDASKKTQIAIQDSLIDLVSERTGYPAEMLSLDLDLEADLSIDSIKRIEILGALAEKLGLDQSSEAERDHMIEELAIMKTLGEMITWLESKSQQDITTESSQDNLDASEDMRPKSEGEHLPRGLRVWVNAPLNHSAASSMTLEPLHNNENHCVVLSMNVITESSQQSESAKTTANALEKVFLSLKELMSDQSCTPKGMLLHAPLPQTTQEVLNWGGLSGLIKTFAREWQHKRMYNLHVRLVFIAQSIYDNLNDLEALISSEKYDLLHLIADEKKVDLSIIRYKDRSCRELEQYQESVMSIDSDHSDKDHTQKETILVTGGARGVTAHCIKALAQREPQHCYILLGRTPHPQQAPKQSLDLAQASNSEQELRAKLIKQDSNIGFAQLKRQAKTLWAQAEIQSTLDALKLVHAEAYYLSLDLTKSDSADELKSILDNKLHVHKLETKQITTVIHAAGTIDDRFMIDKSLESFKKVLKPKIRGAEILLEVAEQAKTWIFFSSVSAALGNQGQSDYAAANACLDLLSEFLAGYVTKKEDSNTKCVPELTKRTLSIQWGPWRGAGMVDESLAALYAEKGLKMINLAEGAQCFVDEWQSLRQRSTQASEESEKALMVPTTVLRTWPFSFSL